LNFLLLVNIMVIFVAVCCLG